MEMMTCKRCIGCIPIVMRYCCDVIHVSKQALKPSQPGSGQLPRISIERVKMVQQRQKLNASLVRIK